MAELPELEYLRKVLLRELSQKRIVEAECLNPDPLEMVVDGDFADRLTGLRIARITRRGPFLLIRTTGKERLVVNPTDEGHFKFPGLGTRRPRTLVFAIHMEGGPRLWFLDPANTAKVYLTTKDRLDAVPTLMKQGADPLGKNFTPERFRRIAKRLAKLAIRDMLMDQTQISHIGPVYADEILYHASVHPKTIVSKLGEDDLDRLFDAILDVLEVACETVEDRGQPIENTVRDFLKCWGRAGDSCRRCGQPIKSIKAGDSEAFVCTVCQKVA
jgi:formamidopyrimidine-DNA glycosylase